MKFSEFEYIRPNIEEIKESFEEFYSKFDLAENVEVQNDLIIKINKVRTEFESMNQIAYLRYCIDTLDKIYVEEQNFFDEIKPIYEGLVSKYYEIICSSKFETELIKKWGSQLFNIAKLKKKAFSEEIIEELKLENKLMSEYTKLLSSSKIYFEGEYRNIPGLRPFEMHKDREIRIKATSEKYKFFKENEYKFDSIFDKLVKLRNSIAKKLGFENFIELGYIRMLRTDYDEENIKDFRNHISNHIVPIADKLRKKQSNRLKIDKIKIYDENISFLDGNPALICNENEILENAKKMYAQLSEETNKFYEYMIDNKLMDLKSKEGKSPAGFCTYIGKYKSPFIFANFNGTLDDIDVLTHEAGHAFQMYLSSEYIIPEYNFPTLDACEIHSMSMEFITWPWMELFFGEDADKYRFNLMNQYLLFIPYAALVDEFQHFVYSNPNITPKERKLAWREIERKYLPIRDYDGFDYLENGGYWHQQGHIFKNPFYYIDYALALIIAFQIWDNFNKDRKKAWNSYLSLCKIGGKKSFLELIKNSNLKSPFEEDFILSVSKEINKWIESIDDINL